MIGETSDQRLTFMGELQVERARTEYRIWSEMLKFLDGETARIEREVEPQQQDLALAAVRSVVAQANGWSEHQIAGRIHEAETARDDLPNVWKAFGEGEIDAARVSVIANGAWKLTKERSIARLDAPSVAFAATHTVGELRRWIKRFIARVEPDEGRETLRGHRGGTKRDDPPFHRGYAPTAMAPLRTAPAICTPRTSRPMSSRGSINASTTQRSH